MYQRQFFFFIFLFVVPSLQSQNSYNESNNKPSDKEIDNLIAFSEIYNCVRYFYPSRGTQSINWEKFAIYGVRNIQNCESKKELIESLQELFLPLCTELKIESMPFPGNLYPLSFQNRKTYIHYGSGKTPYTGGFFMRILYNLDKPYYTKVKPLNKNDSLFWYKDSVADIFFAMPTAALKGKSSDYKVLQKTVDTISIVQLNVKERKTFLNADLRCHRLASVIMAWGNFRHFYPYKDLIAVDWTDMLKEALQEAVSENDYVDFHFTLRKMLSPLNDGHIRVLMCFSKGLYGGCSMGFAPNIFFENINDTLIVKQGTDSLPFGAVIDSVNGLPIQEFVNNKKNYFSASPQLKRKKVAKELLYTYYRKDSLFTIAFTLSDGSKKQTKVSINDGSKLNNTSEFISQKEGIHIFAFKSKKSNSKDLYRTLRSISEDTSAKGVVIDFRDSRFMDHKFLGYFTDSVLYSALFKVSIMKYPKQEHVDYKVSNFKIKPQKERIRIPVVFITDGSVLSYGESVMGIVEHYKLGYIVGEPTAGINGDAASLSLPVHSIWAYTGMRVDKHDGSPLFCVGVTPTHSVKPTVEDFLKGRDIQMEKAFSLIEQHTISFN